MMRLKRKLYSNNVVVSHKSSSLRIKRFSQVREEERLYAFNPFATIKRVNALRGAGIGSTAGKFNNAYKGLNFRQALSQYRQRGQLASTAKSIHKSTVSNWAKNGKLDYRSLQGGIKQGTNLGQSNLVGLSAGVKQASANISNNVRSSSGGGLFKNLFRSNNSADSIMRKDIFKTANPIMNQHIKQSNNLVNSLQNAGVTNVDIGNLTGAQKNQLLNPTLQKSTYNPALDPKGITSKVSPVDNLRLSSSRTASGSKYGFGKGGQSVTGTYVDSKGNITDFGYTKKSGDYLGINERTSNGGGFNNTKVNESIPEFEKNQKTRTLNKEKSLLRENEAKGQKYYEEVFKETGADANSMNNTTFSRSKVMEQQNPKTQTTTQPTQPQEKPFETVGLAKEQPTETGVKAPVENSNPSTTTNPTSTNIDNSKSATNTSNNQNQLVNKTGSDNKSNLEIKSETTIPTTINDSSIVNTQNQFGSKDSNSNNNLKPGSKTTSTNQNQPNNDDKKFRLGWKGKLALGTAAVGGALYGGGKLVSNMMKDDDEKR